MILIKVDGWNMMWLDTVIGIVVVFIALAILVLIFEYIQSLSIKATKKKLAKETGKKEEEIAGVKDIAADEIAAISMALHMFMNDLHDTESNVITIKRIERRYSPWSSKIYGLTNLNR